VLLLLLDLGSALLLKPTLYSVLLLLLGPESGLIKLGHLLAGVLSTEVKTLGICPVILNELAGGVTVNATPTCCPARVTVPVPGIKTLPSNSVGTAPVNATAPAPGPTTTPVITVGAAPDAAKDPASGCITVPLKSSGACPVSARLPSPGRRALPTPSQQRHTELFPSQRPFKTS
jgi:hypothetical protein